MKTHLKEISLLQWNNLSLMWGVLVWLVWLAFKINDLGGQLTQVKLILLLGIAVITPLTLRLVGDHKVDGSFPPIYQAAITLQVPVTLLSGFALGVERGWLGGLLALGWVGLTLLIALYGLLRSLSLPILLIEELCLDVGMMYVAISGFWFIGYHISARFLGFSSLAILLTASHFCFISLGALIIAGMVGRQLTRFRRLYNVAAVGLIVSPPLVALGITITSRTGSVSIFEPIGALGVACSFLIINALTLLVIQPAIQNRLPRTLLILSAAAPLLTMALAIGYPLGNYAGWWTISLSTMLRAHAWINAVVVVGIGLMAWLFIQPASRIQGTASPFRFFSGRWRGLG